MLRINRLKIKITATNKVYQLTNVLAVVLISLQVTTIQEEKFGSYRNLLLSWVRRDYRWIKRKGTDICLQKSD